MREVEGNFGDFFASLREISDRSNVAEELRKWAGRIAMHTGEETNFQAAWPGEWDLYYTVDDPHRTTELRPDGNGFVDRMGEWYENWMVRKT